MKGQLRVEECMKAHLDENKFIKKTQISIRQKVFLNFRRESTPFVFLTLEFPEQILLKNPTTPLIQISYLFL